jgi:hypothetical protein
MNNRPMMKAQPKATSAAISAEPSEMVPSGSCRQPSCSMM